jgi:hypothetical protein
MSREIQVAWTAETGFWRRVQDEAALSTPTRLLPGTVLLVLHNFHRYNGEAIMKEAEFKNLEPLADQIYQRSDEWFDSPAFAAVKAALRDASALLPSHFSVSVEVVFRVFDEKREQDLPLMTTGVNTSGGKEPYRTDGDSTVHRYVTDGEICQVPHDRCPHCWGDWDFKLLHRTWRHCGYALGKEVKLLVDSDVCPNCEQGTVSLAMPICEKCEFVADSSTITWG